MNETIVELLGLAGVNHLENTQLLEHLEKANSRYIRDLKVNLSNAFKSSHLSAKELALLAIAISSNQNNDVLLNGFVGIAQQHEASQEEIAEAIACASLLASNNVVYRFRHFLNKESYNKMPAKIKMNIMMKPVLGKEFFELVSLAVSAVNGCEMCVNAHEASVLKLESTEERIWDAIRLSAVVVSLDKIVR